MLRMNSYLEESRCMVNLDHFIRRNDCGQYPCRTVEGDVWHSVVWCQRTEVDDKASGAIRFRHQKSSEGRYYVLFLQDSLVLEISSNLIHQRRRRCPLEDSGTSQRWWQSCPLVEQCAEAVIGIILQGWCGRYCGYYGRHVVRRRRSLWLQEVLPYRVLAEAVFGTCITVNVIMYRWLERRNIII
jgi:hypothetical protein